MTSSFCNFSDVLETSKNHRPFHYVGKVWGIKFLLDLSCCCASEPGDKEVGMRATWVESTHRLLPLLLRLVAPGIAICKLLFAPQEVEAGGSESREVVNDLSGKFKENFGHCPETKIFYHFEL